MSLRQPLEGLPLQELLDHVERCLGSVVRDLMASKSDSHEGEVVHWGCRHIVHCCVSGGDALVRLAPWVPCLVDGENSSVGETGCPLFVSVEGHAGVGISVVDEDTKLLCEAWVQRDGRRTALCVSEGRRCGGLHVECLLHIVAENVFGDCVELSAGPVVSAFGHVVAHGALDLEEVGGVHSSAWAVVVDVVDVVRANCGVHLNKENVACHRACVHCLVEFAGLLQLCVQNLADQPLAVVELHVVAVCVGSVAVDRRSIATPASVSNGNPLQVDGSGQRGGDEEVRDVRDVLSGVALSGQEEVVLGKLRERGVEGEKGVAVRLCLRGVVPVAGLLDLAVLLAVGEAAVQVAGREEGAGRALQVEHVGNAVPGKLIDVLSAAAHLEVPHLSVLPVERGASRASSVPGHNRVLAGVVLALVELVVDHQFVVAGDRAVHLKVPRVDLERGGREARELCDQVLRLVRKGASEESCAQKVRPHFLSLLKKSPPVVGVKKVREKNCKIVSLVSTSKKYSGISWCRRRSSFYKKFTKVFLQNL